MTKVSVLLLLITISFFSYSQCDPALVITRTVDPNETDSEITAELFGHNVYINPSCEPNNKLLVHLVGSFDIPLNTTYFPILATNNGYKTIVMKYRNLVGAYNTCSASEDINCYDKFREENVYGIDVSSEVDINEANSILNRLQKLLLFEDAEFPSEGWGDFLSETNEIDWSNITLSGHSQGGGHAAFLAKEFSVDRVIMFASPNDYSIFFDAPAPWTSESSATTDSSYYFFGHLNDEVVPYGQQLAILETMILNSGDTIHSDLSLCPYENSRLLYTTSNTSESFHSEMIRDEETPLVQGVPIFTPEWEYLLGLCNGPDAISDIGSADFNLHAFPNPATDFLQIESKEIVRKIEVYDLTGKLLETANPYRSEFKLNVNQFSGMLLIKFTTINDHSKVLKVHTE